MRLSSGESERYLLIRLQELRAIYREHGWGSGHFRKEECREALCKWGPEYERKLLEAKRPSMGTLGNEY